MGRVGRRAVDDLQQLAQQVENGTDAGLSGAFERIQSGMADRSFRQVCAKSPADLGMIGPAESLINVEPVNKLVLVPFSVSSTSVPVSASKAAMNSVTASSGLMPSVTTRCTALP
jgi:hypothetical protein